MGSCNLLLNNCHCILFNVTSKRDFFLFFFFGKNYYFKTGLVLPTIFPCCHMVLMHVLTKALKSILSVQKRGRQQVLSGRYSSVTLQSDCGDGAC